MKTIFNWRRRQNIKREYLSSHLWVLEGNLEENSEEISSVALLSPACFVILLTYVSNYPEYIKCTIARSCSFCQSLFVGLIGCYFALIGVPGGCNRYNMYNMWVRYRIIKCMQHKPRDGGRWGETRVTILCRARLIAHKQ